MKPFFIFLYIFFTLSLITGLFFLNFEEESAFGYVASVNGGIGLFFSTIFLLYWIGKNKKD